MFACLKQSKTVKSEISVDNEQEGPPIVDGDHDVNASTYRKEIQSFFQWIPAVNKQGKAIESLV